MLAEVAVVEQVVQRAGQEVVDQVRPGAAQVRQQGTGPGRGVRERIRREHEVRVTDLMGQHLTDRADVIVGQGESALAEQVVTEHVVDEGADVAHGPDAGQARAGQRPAGAGGPVQRAGQRQRLGPDGWGDQDVAIAAAGDQLRDQGNRVLAQRTADAGVLGLDPLVEQRPTGIGDVAMDRGGAAPGRGPG